MVVLVGTAHAFAADITGTWKASFDTQIGQQNYTFEFVVKGTTLTGKISPTWGIQRHPAGQDRGGRGLFV